jgi:putative transposase
VDSQSAKTTGVEVERDYDVAKRLKGRKRHLLVDTEGLVLRTKVHLASVMDHERIEPLMEPIREHFRRLPTGTLLLAGIEVETLSTEQPLKQLP